MEQLSRSLQTERNTLKQEVKELQDKLNPPNETETNESVEAETNSTENQTETKESPTEKEVEAPSVTETPVE